jgi:hypothetical protein
MGTLTKHAGAFTLTIPEKSSPQKKRSALYERPNVADQFLSFEQACFDACIDREDWMGEFTILSNIRTEENQ